jgi:hypothetical protein
MLIGISGELHLAEHLARQDGAQGRVAVDRRDSDEPQFRCPHRHHQRQNVVDVGADVRVEKSRTARYLLGHI